MASIIGTGIDEEELLRQQREAERIAREEAEASQREADQQAKEAEEAANKSASEAQQQAQKQASPVSSVSPDILAHAMKVTGAPAKSALSDISYAPDFVDPGTARPVAGGVHRINHETGAMEYDLSAISDKDEQWIKRNRAFVAHDPALLKAYDNNSKNKELVTAFNSYSVMGYDGTALNFNTASMNEIINLIKTNPDDETREELVDLLDSATKQEGNRFYGRTFDKTDAKKYLATAALNSERYDEFVKTKLDGKFYPAAMGQGEKNQETYEAAMAWIDNAGLSEYEKHHFRKAVDLAYKRQVGEEYAPPENKEENKFASAQAASQAGVSLHKGLAQSAANNEPVPTPEPEDVQEQPVTPRPSVSTEAIPKVQATPAPTPTPTSTPTPKPSPAPTATPTPEADETQEPEAREVQGPAYQPQAEEPKTSIPKMQKKGTDSVSIFYDRALGNNMTAIAQAEKQGPVQQERAVGTVDYANDPVQALPYIVQNNADLLTEGTLDAVDAWVGQSAGRQAMVGVLTGENLSEFATVGEDGKITFELNNRNANAIYSDNYGILGTMSKYALKLEDPNFPAELLPEAIATLSAAIDDAEYAARNDETGAYNPEDVNIYTAHMAMNPEIQAALDDAFAYEEEVKAKAEEAEKLRFENEAKAKQDRIDQARAACRTGDATPEDWAIVTEEAPDLTTAQMMSDETYRQYMQDIRSGRTLSDAEDDGWFNEQATSYLRGKDINAKAGSIANMEAKDLLASYLEDAAGQLTETAYALGYDSLGSYLEKTGIGLETMQDIALHNMRADERGLTPDVVEKANEIAASSYTGSGDVDFLEAAGKSVALGASQFVQSKTEAWYTLAATTNIPVDSARARALFTNRFGFARAESKLSDQLLQMAEEGYFPNEKMNAYVKSYLLGGGNAFDLGIVPEDLGYVVEWNKNAKARADGIQSWANQTMTPEQGRWFELGAGTTVNFSNQLLAAGLNIVTGGVPGASLLNSMIAYGDSAFIEGFERGIDNGYGLGNAGAIGMVGAVAVALANMGSDKKRASQFAGLINAVEMGVGNTPLPRTLSWYSGVAKASLLAATDTLVDEVIKDELKEGVYTSGLTAGAEALIEGQSLIGAGRAALKNMNVLGNAANVIKNAPENLFHMAPMALLSGTVAGANEWRTYRELKKALKTGKAEDVAKAEQTFVEELTDPEKAQALENGLALADKVMHTAEILTDDTGDIGAAVDAATKAQEQADSHKEKLDASQAALNEATTQHTEAIEAIAAGTADENTVQQAIDSAEAIAQNQTSVAEHQKEHEQKQAEASALYQEATDKAAAEAGQQIMQEQAAAQAAQAYGLENPYPYTGAMTVKDATKSGETQKVVGLVGLTEDGSPVVQLENGEVVNAFAPMYDLNNDAILDFSSAFSDAYDKLPKVSQGTDGNWAVKPPKPNLLGQELELNLIPGIGNGNEKVTVVDIAGVSEETGLPVLELSDGTMISYNTLAYGEGSQHKMFSDLAKANADKLPKIAKGSFETIKSMKAKYAAPAQTTTAPATLLGQEIDVEFSDVIGAKGVFKAVDVVGVTNSGKGVVELSDGTKTNALAFKDADFKKKVAEIVAANKATLPIYNVGEYSSVSDLKAKYLGSPAQAAAQVAPKTTESGLALEGWQKKKYHGDVKEPKKVSTKNKALKAWFNDPTAEKLLTNADGTPKVFYRGFGGFGSKVYMQHESKPHNGKPVNFYTDSLEMSQSYASGNPGIVKHYNIKNWETAKAAMKELKGDLITDSTNKGYRVINRDGTKGKFYKENEIEKFNAEYGNLEGTGIHAGYISVQKPLVLDAKGGSYSSITATVMDKDGNAHKDTKKARWWAHWAWDNGYDSVIIKNVKDNAGGGGAPGLEVITSDSGMYKSIYNTGKFDKANKDIRYYKPGTFALTGELVSQQMQDIQARLSVGDKVTLEDMYSIPELQYAIAHEKKGSSKEDFKDDPEREEKQQEVLDDLTALGSAESILDVDGKTKIVYTGDVKQERRMDIVIGPPAAGKSSVLVDPLSHMFKSRVVDSDMAKELLPEYEGGLNSGYLHEESGMIAKRLLTESMDRGDNIVYPVVGWHLDSLREKIAKYKAADYKVYLHLNELPIEKAMGRMLNRLIMDGRYILPEYPMETVGDRPSAVFEVLKSEEVADGYSKWSNDVEYGKDPVLLYGDGKTEQPVLEGRSLLRRTDGRGSGADQGVSPSAGREEENQGSPEPVSGIKYYKGTQSNQGASFTPKKSEGKAKSPLQVAKKLAEDIGTTVYATKKLTDPQTLQSLPSDVRGYYANLLDSIGIRAKDSGRIIPMYHELSHALGEKTGMKGTQQMVDALPDTFKQNYPANELPDEAMAEFGWRYFYAPQAAEQMAGARFVADFEKALKREGLYKAVKEAQEDIQLYRNQNVTGKTLAHVVDAPTPRKKTAADIVGAIVDETAPLRPMLHKLVDSLGKENVSANMNPVIQARQAQTASIRADRVFDNAVTDANWKVVSDGLQSRIKPLLKTTEDADDYLAYLLDMHALDRNAENKPVFDSFVLPDSALQANIDRIANDKPHVVQAAEETYAFWNDVMQNYMVDTGFMTQAAWDVLRDVYPHYVPTLRDKMLGANRGTGTGDRFTVKRATGSTEDVINPLVSMRAMVEQMVKQVSRNNIALAVDRAYKADPAAMAEFLEPVGKGVRKTQEPLSKAEIEEIAKNLQPGDDLMQAILDKMEEKAAFSVPGRSGETGTMVVQHPDGTTTEYKFQDPEMMKAIAGAGEKGVHGLAQAIRQLTTTMSALTTGNNPMYGVLRNPSRDISESIKYGSWAYSYIDGIPKWLWAMGDVIRGTENYKQYLATGAGGLSAFRGNNLTSATRFLRTLMPGYKPTTKAEKLVAGLETAMDIASIGKFSEWIEQTSRYVEFKYGNLNAGNANAEAGDYSALGVATRDVTVDFYGKGNAQWINDIACVSPFFKAAINGVYRQARMYADPMERDRLPARLAKTVLNTALASAASSLLMLKSLDEEEKEAYTDYLSQNLKTLHWYMPNPAYDAGKSDKRFIRIPLPQDVASYAIHAAVTNAIWLGQEDTLAIEASEVMDTILGSLNPYNGTVFKPFIDASANRTWYGGYIVPRTMVDYSKVSAVNQYTETTPTMYKWAAQALHGAGVEVSPMKIQYVVEQLGGYPAKMLTAALSPDQYTGALGGWSAVGEVWEKTMTSDPYVSQDMTSTYYDAKDLLTRIQNDAKAGKMVAGLRYGLTQNEVDDAVLDAKTLLKGPIAEGGDAINEMYDTIEAVSTNENLTSKQKNDLIREARKECFEILADVNAEMWAYQERYCTDESLLGHFMKNTKPYSLSN